jgi:hypothetical protein
MMTIREEMKATVHTLICNEGGAIVIGNEITVKIVSMKRRSLQVGISAPRQTVIVRAELLGDQGGLSVPSSATSRRRPRGAPK